MNNYSGDLRSLFTDDDLSDSTPVYIYCPAHPDKRRPSMRVYENGAKCFTCGTYLSRRRLVQHVYETCPEAITGAKLAGSSRSTLKSRPQLRLDEVRVLAKMAHENLTFGQRAYFHSRGLNDETIDQYHLGHYGLGYTIPVFDDMGEVIGVKFRRDEAMAAEDTPKYWGLRGHNEMKVYPRPVGKGESIVLVEGEFDALILRQEGINAYSLTTGAGSWAKIDGTTFPPETVVAILYDGDTAGEEAENALIAHLPKMGYIYTEQGLPIPPPYKDATNLWQQRPREFANLVRTYQWTQLNTPPLAARPS